MPKGDNARRPKHLGSAPFHRNAGLAQRYTSDRITTAMDLQFVNVSDPKQIKAGGTRKLVRSHAMRNFRQRQRLGNSRPTHASASDSTQSGEVSGSAVHRSSNEMSRGLRSRYRRGDEDDEDEEEDDDDDDDDANARKFFRGIRMEQIELFPTSMPQKYMFKVFDHYGTAVAGGFLPLGKFVPTNPMRTRILPLAMRDAALFHVTLANAGMDMMVWRGEQFFDPVGNSAVRGRERGNAFCIKHKMEGIRAINERLGDPDRSISDETLLAICQLAAFELLTSYTKTPEERFREVVIHMNGIEQIIKLRGGLKAIGLNTCITHFILRVDHIYSALTGRKPRFPVDVTFDTDLSLTNFTDVLPSGLNSGALHPGIEVILCELRSSSQFLESLENPVSESDFFSFGTQRILIEDQLFKLGSPGSTKNTSSGSTTATSADFSRPLTPIDHCCRFAAILYIQTLLAKVNCKVYRDLVTALRYNLERSDNIPTLRAAAPNLLLWMLLVGGGAAPFNADRHFFLTLLAECAPFESWSQVESLLEGWPWRPKYCFNWRAAWRDAMIAAAPKPPLAVPSSSSASTASS